MNATKINKPFSVCDIHDPVIIPLIYERTKPEDFAFQSRNEQLLFPLSLTFYSIYRVMTGQQMN